MKHIFCKSVSLFITLFMLMLFTSCGTGEIERAEAEFSTVVKLPSNVRVIIQTGGGNSQMQPANTGGCIADSLHG